MDDLGKSPGERAANRVLQFFEKRLKHTKGSYARKPFIPAPWEEKILRDIFGTLKPNGFRQYNTAYISVPKKNGKSELGAGVALTGLLLDDEPGAEIYSAAATRDQAGIVYRVAAQMVRMDPVLSDMCEIVPSSKVIYLKDEPDSIYKVVSADAGVNDGVNPHIVVFDELHRQKNRDLWDIFAFGSPTRDQPLLFAITTAGVLNTSPICEEQHEYSRRILQGIFKDPTYYPVIFGLDMDEDWTLEGHPATNRRPATGWYKANPALGDFLPIERIRAEFKKAKEMPTQQNSFRRFRLNQWVGQASRFLPMQYWKKCAVPFSKKDLVGRECWGGLDMSTTRDLTSFALVFPMDDGRYYALVWLFMPADNLQEAAKNANVPLDQWVSQGFIQTTPGNQVDYGYVREFINKQYKIYNIKEIGYDRWNAIQIVQDLKGDGLEMTPIGQGYQSMNAPTSELLSLITADMFRPGENPVLDWMADCMTVKQDPAGNVKPEKPDRMKKKVRIDGIVAIIDALACILRTDKKPSIYNQEGISCL